MGETAGDAIVTLRGVTKRFDDFVAVDRLDLDVRNGEFLALLGPSGCGKTTTLRMIAGFEEPSEGELEIDGAPVVGVPPNRRQVNTVFQAYALFPHMTVLDNVAYGLKQRKVARKERYAKAAEALALVHLEGREQARPNQLSGGMQQRVALARALVLEPKVLLLDEPLGALDQKLRKAMQIELKRIQSEVGITFVFVTHDQEEAMAMADRIAVMNEGHIEQLAVPSELYDAPATPFVADFIGDMSQVTGTLSGDEVALPGGGRISLGRRLVEASNGAEVTVGLRPEGAVLRASGSADVQASVVTAMVLGDRLQLVIRLADDQELLIRQGRSPEDGDLAALEPGDAVGVQFRPRAGLLMGVGARRQTATAEEELEPTLRGAAT
ncbi:MAG: spermidine/putrescine transport system ATP-binding protein [Solirubrobacteraceae bacterium]|jgi:spermidine/putrescine transport system ATP-binding protein|nr:spermidine/putrescine transport system ATP-binding protein [Solirubrobacteraceae bacterium]